MRYQVKIRQEQPKWTRAPHPRRFWELYVVNRHSKVYEYYASVWSFEDAIELSCRVWMKSNHVSPLEFQEAPC